MRYQVQCGCGASAIFDNGGNEYTEHKTQTAFETWNRTHADCSKLANNAPPEIAVPKELSLPSPPYPKSEAERCDQRYPVPMPRDEPFPVTYRCGLMVGHQGPCGSDYAPVAPSGVVRHESSGESNGS